MGWNLISVISVRWKVSFVEWVACSLDWAVDLFSAWIFTIFVSIPRSWSETRIGVFKYSNYWLFGFGCLCMFQNVSKCIKKQYAKVLFLAAVSRSRWDSSRNQWFHGKLGIFPFVFQQRALRRSSSNNLVADTVETRNVSSRSTRRNTWRWWLKSSCLRSPIK